MSDLISRQAVIDEIWKLRRSQQMLDDTQRADLVMHGLYLCEKAVEKLPSAQPRTGKWIIDNPHSDDSLIYRYACSECRAHHRARYDFCPNCGADMREGATDD